MAVDPILLNSWDYDVLLYPHKEHLNETIIYIFKVSQSSIMINDECHVIGRGYQGAPSMAHLVWGRTRYIILSGNTRSPSHHEVVCELLILNIVLI